ncbi:HAD family hydrolase [Frigoribacterium sp. CFBP 13707]|uniref:HAD family hydrolase n=1 Tax=Frigoribacterium sp. CFBP 13707 TaxID=2775313 RepID=UPI0035300D12
MTDLLPAAVLWDMDGTLVDTEPYWFESQVALVGSFGGTWTKADGDTLIGSGLWHSSRVLQQHGVDMSEDDIIDHLTTAVLERCAVHIPWRPGAKELLAELRAAGVPTALVTMSIRRMALFMVDAIEFDAFDAVVAGDDVEHAKPHPEAYLRGAELLGVDVADCVAVEDSVPGLASAVAAGAVALGVEHHAPLADDAGYVRRTTLVGTTLADLRELHAAGRRLREQRTTDS